jgi:hypothetical protein
VVPEKAVPRPQSSYGAQKLMIETLINDISRRGLIDGRVYRLPNRHNPCRCTSWRCFQFCFCHIQRVAEWEADRTVCELGLGDVHLLIEHRHQEFDNCEQDSEGGIRTLPHCHLPGNQCQCTADARHSVRSWRHGGSELDRREGRRCHE